MSRSDVISGRASVSDVILGARVVARVFEGRPGVFYWVHQLNDAMPEGPFFSRDDAELDADIRISQDLNLDTLLTWLDH